MAEARVELDRAMTRRPRLPVEILADEAADVRLLDAEHALGEILEALPRSLAEAWRMGQCAASQGIRNNPFVE